MKYDKTNYLLQMADREWPEHVEKAFKNCKTKVRHCVSKITIEGTASDNTAKEILEWVKESKPIVVHKQSWPTSYKGGK